MTEGDIVLTPLPQADGRVKNRPALILREFPAYGDFLVCGISTQIRQSVPGFDDIIRHSDADFPRTGLVAESLIRLGFLAILPRSSILGSIGAIVPERHAMLLRRLARHLIENLPTNG
uniref:mRNA interferase MazF n=1 Tax=Candidatus Kentrum sp. DK TaxID=2126562 RepID=A0A450THX2_9GAMM|nr:MAG: mRNA interferase MazF [Candidatus Kentron sp. DK]VFJ68238.1 MAG: mRNA interferase MazF [Candidatus Kentron sp. DK]